MSPRSDSTAIEVWAPSASRVEIEFRPATPGAPDSSEATGAANAPQRREMSRRDDGWWRWDGEPAAYPLDYAFVLDGEEPALPDPRSPWQPDGVHGPSRTFDASAFAWSDAHWRGSRSGAGALGAVIYELHVGTFTEEGTLDSAIERLDGLVELGVDIVEMMPVAAFDGSAGWGYDGVALYAVHQAYGGPEALQRFVDAAHARGLGVCLDVVYNHLGPSGNYLGRFGPYFTQAHTTPWGPAVNLDQEGSSAVRAFIIDNALRWLRDFHLDALRLDAVHELIDDSPRHLLAELSDAVAALADEVGRPLDLIAESDLNDTVMVTPTTDGGRGMTAQWDDDIHHALHVALTGESFGYYADFVGGERLPEDGPVEVLAKVLADGFLHDGRVSSFRGVPWGRPVAREAFDARRLLGYLQTHDQVGNRAIGDRISETLTPAQQAAGAALYLLAPSTPMIFMGEEFRATSPFQFFTSFPDEALAEAVRAGRRAEFSTHGWDADAIPDPQAEQTRSVSVLRWDEAAQGDHARMREWYQLLIAWRHKLIPQGETSLANVKVEFDEAARWISVRHELPHLTYAVLVTLGETGVEIPGSGGGEVLASWGDVSPGEHTVGLGGHAVAVVGFSANG